MRKNDLLLVAFLLFLAAAIYIFLQPKDGAADYSYEIRLDAAVLHTVKVSELRTNTKFHITTEHGKVIVDLDPSGGASIISSPCPDKLCIHQGHINKIGQTVLCLPEKVLVTVTGTRKEGEPDAVLR